MSAQPEREVLMTALASPTPDLGALVWAVALVAAALARAKKSKREPVLIAHGDEGVSLRIYPKGGLVHDAFADDLRVLIRVDRPEVSEGVWDESEAAFCVTHADGASFRWPWALVASGVSEALRNTVPQSKSRKPILCSECGKRIIR